MQKICISCNYVGKEVRRNYIYILLPAILLFFGLESLYYSFYLIDQFVYFVFSLIASLVWIFFAYISIKAFINGKDGCPNCKSRKTMIPLDTPRAQELIKENNLTVPTESTEQTKAPST